MKKNLKILLVEDDPKSLFALQSVLQHHGHQVTACEDAEIAAKSDHMDFDVAIVDVRLPLQQGTEFARQLKKRKPYTKIIFMTAYDDLADDKYPLQDIALIVKPIDISKLLEAL